MYTFIEILCVNEYSVGQYMCRYYPDKVITKHFQQFSLLKKTIMIHLSYIVYECLCM